VFTTSPVSPPLGGGTPTPSLSGLRVSPRTFLLRGHRVGGRCAAAIKRHAGDQPCRRPIKLTVVYTLNTADTVTFTFKRKTRARTAGHRCVKPTVDRRQTDRCTRWIGLPARLTTVGAVGDNSFAFYGKVGGNRLHPGTYRLTATPSGGAPHTVTLKIVT
jgi:hypothetical protein